MFKPGCPPAEGLSVDFSADDTTPVTNQTVTFTDLTTGAATWLWDFGDGELSTLQNPTHAYKYAGTYTVILHADDGSVGGFTSKTNYITVTLQTVYQTNLQMHNKAMIGASPSNATLVAGLISQWNDDTANAYHRTQGTTVARPTYTQSALTAADGTVYGSADYDGGNDFLLNNNAGFTRSTGSYEVIFMKLPLKQNSATEFFCGAGASFRYEGVISNSLGGLQQSAIRLNNGTAGNESAGYNGAEWTYVMMHFNGASSSIQINDNTVQPVTSVSIGTDSGQGSSQGALYTGAGACKVSIVEHLIYSSKPSDSDIENHIINYMKSKFGLW